MSYKKLLKLLEEARWALVTDYSAAGGDEEAKTNCILLARGRLIDRIDRALAECDDAAAQGASGGSVAP